MNWDSVQLDAKAKGVLVFAMDQAQTPVLTQPGPWGSAYDGYCIGLAACWIAWRYQGKTFPASGQVCDYPPWQSTTAQNLSDAMKRVEWTDGWKAATASFACTVSTALHASRDRPPSAGFFWSILSKAYGCYGVSLRGASGAHAIALAHDRHNRYHLFDANYFHIMMDSESAFRSYVTRYLDKTGYKTTYNTKCGIVGIRPPHQ